jgi:hypothetical protein
MLTQQLPARARCILLQIFGELLTQKQSEDHATRLKEDDFFILKNRLPAKPINVEAFRDRKVFHSECHDADSSFHRWTFAFSFGNDCCHGKGR